MKNGADARTVLYLNYHEDEEKHRRKLAGIRRFAATRGWNVVAVPHRQSRPRSVPALLARFRPAGCIVESSRPDEAIPPTLFAGRPVVRLDPPEPSGRSGAASVVCDNAAVARAAFRELSSGLPPCYAAVPSRGRQRWSAERIGAFRALCAEAGRPCRVFRDRAGDGPARRRARLAAWIAALPAGCAVFAANDYAARDVALAARDVARSIPRELSLVGADGWLDDGGSGILPRVSSVQIDLELAGYLAARLLAETMKGRAERETKVAFGPLCVLRHESTRGRGRRDPHVLDAVEIICREATAGLTAAALAARIPGSRKHFERRFREAMGHSVLDEILHVRLQAVKDLLARPEPPIGAIADFCGFGSQVQLRILFRARTGMSLRDWRRNHLGQAIRPS